MAHRLAITVTTIGDGNFLREYAQSIHAERMASDVKFIVIPDRKSPPELLHSVAELNRSGINAVCPTLEEQDEYVRKLGALKEIIPYNSDNRRNIAYLMALEEGCDALISVDDDNFPQNGESFLAEHLAVNQRAELDEIASSTGWYNICDMMEVEPLAVFPRGYPYCQRRNKPVLTKRRKPALVHINAGLWLRHPDVDAVTLLGIGPRAVRFRGPSVLLSPGTWTPINTQNTAISRAVIPAFYFLKMGYPAMGIPIDRDGDIFCGYFALACTKHLGYAIRVGTPLTDHRRNSHNYLRDLTYELACICMLEDVTAWLQEVKLEGSNYFEAYGSLAERLDDQAERFKGLAWNDVTRGYLHYTTYCMRTWLKAVALIGVPDREVTPLEPLADQNRGIQ